jgi:hypothetical protein
VRKPAQGGMIASAPGEFSRFDGPLVHQDNYTGVTERHFVFMDAKPVSYEITAKTLDYRADPDPIIKRIEPSDIVVQDLREILMILGWQWAGMDVIADRGMRVVLDVNPSPMFLGWSAKQEVLQTLCKELAK